RPWPGSEGRARPAGGGPAPSGISERGGAGGPPRSVPGRGFATAGGDEGGAAAGDPPGGRTGDPRGGAGGAGRREVGVVGGGTAQRGGAGGVVGLRGGPRLGGPGQAVEHAGEPLLEAVGPRDGEVVGRVLAQRDRHRAGRARRDRVLLAYHLEGEGCVPPVGRGDVHPALRAVLPRGDGREGPLLRPRGARRGRDRRLAGTRQDLGLAAALGGERPADRDGRGGLRGQTSRAGRRVLGDVEEDLAAVDGLGDGLTVLVDETHLVLRGARLRGDRHAAGVRADRHRPHPLTRTAGDGRRVQGQRGARLRQVARALLQVVGELLGLGVDGVHGDVVGVAPDGDLRAGRRVLLGERAAHTRLLRERRQIVHL